MRALANTAGENHRQAKLNNRKVIRIRRLFDLGFRGKQAASRYGISDVQFNKIGRRAAWRSVEEQTRG